MSGWTQWVGREDHREDHIDPAMVNRWLATFDRAASSDGHVPQGLHWCLCLPEAATAQLGPDGHPVRDDSAESFLPPVPLPRRMWAASKVDFVRPLKLGEAVARHSKILAVTQKDGNSGSLVFVDIEHLTSGEAGLAVREVQSLVYRAAAAQDAPLSPPEPGPRIFDGGGWEAHRLVTPSAPLLFRYSALTFNSHRIHYDLPYARDTERYRGLVVHGPLTATLLLDLAQRELGDNRLGSFSFRGLSPAICGEELHLVLRRGTEELELAAFAADGRAVMSATAKQADNA